MLSGFVQRSSSFGFICNLRVTRRSPRILSLFHTGRLLRRDKKKHGKGDKSSFWSWSKKNDKDDEKLKIIKPDVCDGHQTGKIILDPECKVAIVVGGVAEIGLSAADSLLYHGARAVVLADEDTRVGENAAQSLCDFYGKNRARFLRCDPKNTCQLESIFEEAICRYKKVDVLFSNLDRGNSAVWPHLNSQETEAQWSNTMRAIHTGMKYMGGKGTQANPGGIIVNCASIIGFMGWPGDPTPVYCSKEPVAETTMDLAKTYPVETKGVRIVALLRSNKPFSEIGLPDFPGSNAKSEKFLLHCEPSAESRIGRALIHIMSQASTGTTWLSEPAPCLREIPWQIHFPVRQGETVDPRIYDKENYKIDPSFKCVVAPSGNCPPNCAETKCKEIWKTKK